MQGTHVQSLVGDIPHTMQCGFKKKKSLPVGEELMMKDDERSVEFH